MKPLIKNCFMILLSLTFLSGCSPVLDGYRELRVSRGIAGFSFEYPAGWHLENISTEPDGTKVSLGAKNMKTICDYSRGTTINLYIVPQNQTMPDAATLLEQDLALWQTQPGFNFGGKSEVIIDGCPAERCRFSCGYIYDGTLRSHGTLPEITVEFIYFSHDDCVYCLEILSNPQSLKTEKKYIERILSTFRLLE